MCSLLPPTLHFAIMADTLKHGLEQQIEQFLTEHPATKLVVIDTLQRVRSTGGDSNLYANDYQDVRLLKQLADSKDCTGASKISTLQIEKLLSGLLREQTEINAPAKVLLEKIDPAGRQPKNPRCANVDKRNNKRAIQQSDCDFERRRNGMDELSRFARKRRIWSLRRRGRASIAFG